VDAAARDFHLHPNSLAIDVGMALSEVPDDFDAVSRPRGVGYDIGAFESHISIAAPVPETAPPEAGPEQITISWSSQHAAGHSILQAPEQVLGYNIYYDLPGGELFLDSVGLTTSYVDTGLTAGQEYCYLVTSLEPEGESRFGSAQCATALQPTSVRIAALTAQYRDDDILITWQTASETNLVGFELYRSEGQDEALQRLNESLIPAQGPGSPSGWAYEYLDTTAVPGVTYHYWLDAVDAYGQAIHHGPVVAWSHRAFLPVMTQKR
jgi:hypothetical protein